MRMATHDAPRITPRSLIVEAPEGTEIRILENPVTQADPQLGRAVEQEVRAVLGEQGLGELQVRFGVCRDETDGFRFVCKVETPLTVPDFGRAAGWRWWSPLLATAQEFHDALEEALQVRRSRLASSDLTVAY